MKIADALPKRKQAPVRRDLKMAVANQIVRITGANPLRIRWDKLDDAEQRELVELTVKTDIRIDGRATGGFNLDQLSKGERSRWERLVEKGSIHGGYFSETRNRVALGTALADAEHEARKPKRRIRLEQEGSITLPREWCFDWFTEPNPALSISDLGLLMFVWSQLENAANLMPGGAVEGAGDDLVLVINTGLGLGEKFMDDEFGMPRWKTDLDHLATNEFFEIEKAARSGGSGAARGSVARPSGPQHDRDPYDTGGLGSRRLVGVLRRPGQHRPGGDVCRPEGVQAGAQRDHVRHGARGAAAGARGADPRRPEAPGERDRARRDGVQHRHAHRVVRRR